MSVISLILVIGVLNLCLGYALAAHLGYGLPSLQDTWQGLLADRPHEHTDSEPATTVEEPTEGLIEELVSGPKNQFVLGSREQPGQASSEQVAPEPGEQPELSELEQP